MNQDLMLFEAEAVAAEAAKCDAQRAAEQHEREAKAAAKVLLQAARDKIKAEKLAKTEDWRRRTLRAFYRQRSARDDGQRQGQQLRSGHDRPGRRYG